MGRVADRRAAAKAAGQSLRDYKAANPSSSSPAPKPSPKPSPKPAPSPSRSPQPSPARVSVADRRAAQQASGLSMKDYKVSIAPPARVSVADRRTAQQASGLSMKDYKAKQALEKAQASRIARRTSNEGNIQQNVSNARDYDYTQYRKGSVNSQEITNLRDQGFSRDEIQQLANDSGLRLGKSVEKRFDRWDAKKPVQTPAPLQPRYEEPTEPPPQPVQPPATEIVPPSPGGGHGGYTPPTLTFPGGSFEPPVMPIMPTFPGIGGGGGSGTGPEIPTFDGSFTVGGDINADIGKDGDMTTTIGDYNTIGAGSSIGNDYSVTIGSQSFGNNNSGGLTGGYGSTGGPFGGNSNPLASMQQAAAYGALNDNAWARSRAQLNGYGRAAGASQEAARITGATDRVGTLYNFAGQSQNYWNQKATAQQGFYLGDMFNYRAPNWVMPPPPKQPEDKTEEIANSLDF